MRTSAQAIDQIEQAHEERLAGQRPAAERAQSEADRARRQFDACEPVHRLVARTLESRLEEALGDLERERRRVAAVERRRPEPLSADERQAAWAPRARPAAPVGRPDHHVATAQSCCAPWLARWS